MYLHIGGKKLLSKNDIVAVLDMETTSVSKKTMEFLRSSDKKGEVITFPRKFENIYSL